MSRELNEDQTALLKLLYRFRFGTTSHINQFLGFSSRTSINARLETLHKHEYIGKRYEKSYKLLGKPATYYLLKKSFPVLREKQNISQVVLKNIYKDAKATDKFITACLSIFGLHNLFKSQHGERLKFFTKADVANYSYFPKPPPDAFLAFKEESATKRFFVLIFESSVPTFALNRRIQQFVDYYEDGEWDVTNSDFPAILIICDAPMLQNRVEKIVLRGFGDIDEGLVVAATNWHILTSGDQKVWRLAGEDELLSLREL